MSSDASPNGIDADTVVPVLGLLISFWVAGLTWYQATLQATQASLETRQAKLQERHSELAAAQNATSIALSRGTGISMLEERLLESSVSSEDLPDELITFASYITNSAPPVWIVNRDGSVTPYRQSPVAHRVFLLLDSMHLSNTDDIYKQVRFRYINISNCRVGNFLNEKMTDYRNLNWEMGRVTEVSFRNCRFINCKFFGVVWKSVNFDKVVFEDSEMQKNGFIGCEFRNLTFNGKCNLESSAFVRDEGLLNKITFGDTTKIGVFDGSKVGSSEENSQTQFGKRTKDQRRRDVSPKRLKFEDVKNVPQLQKHFDKAED